MYASAALPSFATLATPDEHPLRAPSTVCPSVCPYPTFAMTNSTSSFDVTVVGAGLAGCEAAYQLAERGFRVRLFEMKPAKRTPAQTSDYFAELVCSNSLRGAALANAVGLLKEEL